MSFAPHHITNNGGGRREPAGQTGSPVPAARNNSHGEICP